jgi:hypothetical protein
MLYFFKINIHGENMKSLIRTLSFILLTLFVVSSVAIAQDLTPRQQRKVERKQKRALKKAFKKLRRNVLKNPVLREEFFSIINQCPEFDEACQERLEQAVQSSVQGTNVEVQAGGLTFGICHPADQFQAVHRVVYSKKNYDCKLSSHGKVYDKQLKRRLYGPGLIWDKQSVVIMCTGPAYGKSTIGTNIALGVGFGIALGSSFGKVGLCLAVGAGKSVGFFIGGEKLEFEALDEDTLE